MLKYISWKIASLYRNKIRPALIEGARQIVLSELLERYEDEKAVQYVQYGIKSGYEPCCIEFFVRCTLLWDFPIQCGGMPDKQISGYIRCPACVEKMREEADRAWVASRRNEYEDGEPGANPKEEEKQT